MNRMKPRLGKRRLRVAQWIVYTIGVVGVAAMVFVVYYRPTDSVLQTSGGAIEGVTNIHARVGAATDAPFVFTEQAEESGIQFQHFPFKRSSVIVEDMGSGMAWGDYDKDGDSDLFLVNIAAPLLGSASLASTEATHALFQNQGDGLFRDVSEEANINTPSVGMGAAWGDYDNDGDLDLYVTNYGPNFLYENKGDGSFVEIGERAGVNDPLFGTGSMWGDYNRDGWIDLYVCNYVNFIYRESDRARRSQFKRVVYPYTLNPSSFQPQPNRLYQNNGDGTFTDVAEALKVHNPEGRSLCAAWSDFNLDGFVDLYIANDVSSNALYQNKSGEGFDDISSSSLTADYRGAMGIAVGDFDRDLDFDLLITHWIAQENALFQNMKYFMKIEQDEDQSLFFTDVADEYGLGQISLDMVGWSTSLVDFDNDGWLDLWISNGSTMEDPQDPHLLVSQRVFLFRRVPSKGFQNVAAAVGGNLDAPVVSRGGAFADYNNDGKVDFAIQRFGSTPLLFRNDSDSGRNWVQLDLRQTAYNTYALGARVTIRTSGGVQTQQVGSQGSYLSQNQAALHFGLDQDVHIEEIQITWPDGVEEHMTEGIEINKKMTLTHQPIYKKNLTQ